MHIHILGIGEPAMCGVAILAKQAGCKVSGCDNHVNPVLQELLKENDIETCHGYDVEQLKLRPDVFVVGEHVTRSMPLVEMILTNQLDCMSGPEWLQATLLKQRWVITVTGSHGKTSTAAMLAWIMESAWKHTGFMLGAVHPNFATLARLNKSQSPYFIVDCGMQVSSVFDNRPMYLQYKPKTLVLTNLQGTSSGPFGQLGEQENMAQLLRKVANDSAVIYPGSDGQLQQLMARSMHGRKVSVQRGASWQLEPGADTGFSVLHHGVKQGEVHWGLHGQHHLENALLALAASEQLGVVPALAVAALSTYLQGSQLSY